MKNSTSFKSVQIGNSVQFIDNNDQVRTGAVVCIKRSSFTIEYVYQLPNGQDSVGSEFFNLKDGSHRYKNSVSTARAIEIL